MKTGQQLIKRQIKAGPLLVEQCYCIPESFNFLGQEEAGGFWKVQHWDLILCYASLSLVRGYEFGGWRERHTALALLNTHHHFPTSPGVTRTVAWLLLSLSRLTLCACALQGVDQPLTPGFL